MKKLVGIAMLVVALYPSFDVAQQSQVGTWKSYTDMKSVRSVAFSPSGILAATGGGMFRYDGTTGTFTRWTNSENLSTNDLTALMVDKKNRMWIGSSNGAVDVFDPSNDSWQSIQDIANSNRSQKAVRGFFEKGDSVFIATDFGVSVFLISQWEFGDTYANFGFSTQPTVTEVAVVGNSVFVGTDQGVAAALLSSPNLSSPTSWTVYAAAQGLTTTGVMAMAVFRDTLLVGTSNGLFSFSGSGFQQVSATSGKSVVAIVSYTNGFAYVWNSPSGFAVESGSQVAGFVPTSVFNGPDQATSLAEDLATSTIYVGTAGQGVNEWNGTQRIQRLPNGPHSSLFISLCVDANGVVWGASGIDGGGRGFYRFNPVMADSVRWKNFFTAQNPILGSDDYYKASVGANGAVWISAWGEGVVEITGDTIQRKINTTSNPALVATLPPPPFIVVGGVAVDPSGSTWFVDRTAINGNFLAKLVGDTAFQFYRNLYNPGDGFLSSLVIDQNGSRWFANSEPTKKASNGLYYFNDEVAIAGTAAYGGWGNMTMSDGLPNNTVLSLAVDQENNIWIGTDLGVMIVTNAMDPKNSSMTSFPLREQSIQAIAVDALDDKWIGTKEGVFVVNSDGTQLLNQYTVLNTNGKLLDNDIRAIAIDQRRGIVYIGTQKGMSALQIAAVQSLRSYTTIQVGPNPYVLPNPQPLVINNLVSSTTIKILAVNGTLITEFSAQGAGRAFWDGRDHSGKLVQSGVYYIVAFTENGNQVANGKVAVVRK